MLLTNALGSFASVEEYFSVIICRTRDDTKFPILMWYLLPAMQHGWKLYQIIIYSLSIHRSVLCNLRKRNLPWNSHTLNAQTYQADRAYYRRHHLDKSSLSNSFFGCSMCIYKSIYTVHMANFLYEPGSLGPSMYGYATVSYDQIWEHLKFWQAHTTVTTAVFKAE